MQDIRGAAIVMIATSDTHPERDVYYLGAKIIEILSETNKREWDCIELFETLRQSNGIELKLFILCLDWLFMINVIENNERGDVIRVFEELNHKKRR